MEIVNKSTEMNTYKMEKSWWWYIFQCTRWVTIMACYWIECHSDKGWKYQTCQAYPGYFPEPHWISMGLPEIFRVTLTSFFYIDCFIRAEHCMCFLFPHNDMMASALWWLSGAIDNLTWPLQTQFGPLSHKASNNVPWQPNLACYHHGNICKHVPELMCCMHSLVGYCLGNTHAYMVYSFMLTHWPQEI